jgi:putrescine transport system ATP-binding protein
VHVTHDQEEAMTMADRIAVMSAGQFRQVGPPREIYETPNCRFVADFIGNVNLFDGHLAEDMPDYCVIDTPHGAFYVGHGITGVQGQALSVALRPEKIELAREAPPDVSRNCLRGEVIDCAYFGASSLYRLRLPTGLEVQAAVPNTDRHGEPIEVGETVYATCASNALVVLTQ